MRGIDTAISVIGKRTAQIFEGLCVNCFELSSLISYRDRVTRTIVSMRYAALSHPNCPSKYLEGGERLARN